MIKFSSDLGFTTNAISNGWLIDEEMAKRIGDSGLGGINLSLDSLNEATHDYLRGVKGVYRRVMNAIEYLNKYRKRTKVGLCCVIYDWNLDEIPFLLDCALANEALNSVLFMVPMQPNNTGIEQKWWEGEYGFLWPRNTDKACFFIDSLLKQKAIYPHKIGNTVAQLEAFKLYLRFPEKFVKKTKCNLDRAVHVSAFGDIFLCFRWAELGTIRHEHDIRQLWYSQRARDVRKNIAGCRDNCHFLLNCFFEGDYSFGLKEDKN